MCPGSQTLSELKNKNKKKINNHHQKKKKNPLNSETILLGF